MPTYQYSCTECGHFFEQFQSFSEDSLTVCPQCQGRLRKVFNAVGVVFKGSGFYRTDSRADGAKAESRSSSSGGSSSSSDGGSGSSDGASKPSAGSGDKAAAGGSSSGGGGSSSGGAKASSGSTSAA